MAKPLMLEALARSSESEEEDIRRAAEREHYLLGWNYGHKYLPSVDKIILGWRQKEVERVRAEDQEKKAARMKHRNEEIKLRRKGIKKQALKIGTRENVVTVYRGPVEECSRMPMIDLGDFGDFFLGYEKEEYGKWFRRGLDCWCSQGDIYGLGFEAETVLMQYWLENQGEDSWEEIGRKE